MKITIAPVVAGPAWGTEVVLTAGLQASPERFVLNGTSIVDLVPVLESQAQLPIDRANQTNTISWQYTDEKASFQLSEEDLILYKSTLPNFGLVRFYAEQNLSVVFAYLVGSITQFSHSQTGVTTIRGFTIAGGLITTTLPPAPGPVPPLPPPTAQMLVIAETPAGAINSSNQTFTTAANFAQIWVYLNGLRMKPTVDFNVSGANAIHFLYAPTTGDSLLVDYLTA